MRCAECLVRLDVPRDASEEEVESAQFFHRLSGTCCAIVPPEYHETGKMRKVGKPRKPVAIVKMSQLEKVEQGPSRRRETRQSFIKGLLN